MKKKYFIIMIIMIFAIVAIVYHAMKWAQISMHVKAMIQIESITYKLEIENEKQKLLLASLEIADNYDAMVNHTKILHVKSEELKSAILAFDEPYLVKLWKIIEKKNKELAYIYEDIKTDNAEIKNSLKWLSDFYTKHMHSMKKAKMLDDGLMQYVFTLLDVSRSDEIMDIEPFRFQTQNGAYTILKIHLKTLRHESEKLMLLKKDLTTNDISIDTNKINNYIDATLTKLRAEAMTIVTTLLLSVVFLIFFGLFVYVREIRITIRAANLKNELQQFVDALNESSIVSKSDLAGNISYVNDKFCEISGYTREELIGQNHNIIRHPDNPASIFKDLWDTITDKKIFRVRLKNINKNGETYYVDTFIIPMVNIKNEIVEYLAVRYDVSELIESRDEAILAEKAKDEFLSNMSHELRTPLNAINGFSTILKREVVDEKHSLYLQNIIDSSDNLLGLIGDILDLSKLQSGKFTLDYHDFNIQEKLKQFLVRFDAQLALLKLDMQVELDASVNTTLYGDWLRISQIITNLISNALKFTPTSGVISLHASYKEGSLYLSVADSGIGMSKEVQDKIFKPFEQADTSTTRKYGGTGLGLSIVFNLVEQMRGTIELTSKEEEGSKFEIIIPLDEVQIDESEVIEESYEDRDALHGHILIAEDNKTNQMLIGILVEELGLTYTMANDGVEAVAMFGKEKFNLVLMDENMPNMNGTQAVKEIHALYGDDVPVVALTANVMSGDKEKFLKAGMDAYVAKPIDENELYKVLKSFLDTKA